MGQEVCCCYVHNESPLMMRTGHAFGIVAAGTKYAIQQFNFNEE